MAVHPRLAVRAIAVVSILGLTSSSTTIPIVSAHSERPASDNRTTTSCMAAAQFRELLRASQQFEGQPGQSPFAPEWGAGGGPIADCLETANIVGRLEAGLPRQEDGFAVPRSTCRMPRQALAMPSVACAKRH